jgi:hypothetical protein
MRTRHLAAPTAVLLSLSFISGPAFAEDAERGTETEECPAPDLSGVPFNDAAATAIDAVDGLTDANGTCSELEEGRVRAEEALEEALGRLPDEAAGVAGDVLAALLEGSTGEEIAVIARGHGAAIAGAAAERRQGGRPSDDAVDTDVTDANPPELPTTPAVPSVPVPPAPPETPVRPDTPVVPPAPPETPVQAGRPTDG